VKFFGEYLVDKGIISDDQLVQTLIEQSKVTPLAIEIAYQKKIFSPAVLLTITKTQMEKRIDFKTACKEMKLWTSQIETDIESAIHSSRTPIGHLLVKKGLTDLVAITKAMDDFLSRATAPVSQETAPAPASAAAPAATTATATKAVPAFSNIFLDELLHFFSETKANTLTEYFKNVSQTAQTSEFYLGNIKPVLTEVHMLRGLMKTLKFEQVDQMAQMYEMYTIRLLDTKLTPDYLQFLPAYALLGQEFVVHFSNFLSYLKVNPSAGEKGWHNDQAVLSTHTALFQRITDACLEVI
jgi:hypothetical protein